MTPRCFCFPLAPVVLLASACTTEAADTAEEREGGPPVDTSEDPEPWGSAPVITALEVKWEEFGDYGVSMYADATIEDADGDLVGGFANFDVSTGSGQPLGFTDPIRDCADVSGACWIPPHLIVAIPDVITANDYSVELVVVDAGHNESAPMTGFLAGG